MVIQDDFLSSYLSKSGAVSTSSSMGSASAGNNDLPKGFRNWQVQVGLPFKGESLKQA